MFDDQLEKHPAKPDQLYWKDFPLNLLSLDVLRHEFLEFLTQNRLPSVWAKDDFAWKETLKFYGEEIRDTPLILKGKNLKHLRKLVITSCEPAESIVKANPQYTWWGLKWQFTLSDGSTFSTPYSTNLQERPANWKTQGTIDPMD